VALLGLITYGLKGNDGSNRKFNPTKQKRASKSLPSIDDFARTKKQNEEEALAQDAYSGMHESSSPGENPYG
jgi:hypothetical protein